MGEFMGQIKGRLFTFGCSFTKYHWPTWADILGREYGQFFNYGKAGAGNFYILNKLIEATKLNMLTESDTVIIMWTSIGREDRWSSNHGGWITEGSIFNQSIFSKEFVSEWADPNWYLIRDLTCITSAKKILESIGCKWHFLSMVPIEYYDDSNYFKNSSYKKFNVNKNIQDLFLDELNAIQPSVYEIIFNFNWYSRPFFQPEKYNKFAGAEWPSAENFLKRKFLNVKQSVIDEIENIDCQIGLTRSDFHPTPLEHLEYITKILIDPGLIDVSISNDTMTWINETDNKVLKGEL